MQSPKQFVRILLWSLSALLTFIKRSYVLPCKGGKYQPFTSSYPPLLHSCFSYRVDNPVGMTAILLYSSVVHSSPLLTVQNGIVVLTVSVYLRKLVSKQPPLFSILESYLSSYIHTPSSEHMLVPALTWLPCLVVGK